MHGLQPSSSLRYVSKASPAVSGMFRMANGRCAPFCGGIAAMLALAGTGLTFGSALFAACACWMATGSLVIVFKSVLVTARTGLSC